MEIEYWKIPKGSILWCKKTIGNFKKENAYKSVVEDTIRADDEVDHKIVKAINLWDYFIPPKSHKRKKLSYEDKII